MSRLEEAARSVVAQAAKRGLTVSTAESCTAGMVASALADIPGASAVLRGGAVTYCDEIKHRVLGVASETLADYTAVSEQTAREMAEGSVALFEADLAVSLTGYAGPGGGTPDDPCGTVYFATHDRLGTSCVRCSFTGSRNEIRVQAAQKALELLSSRLELL